MNLQLWTGEKIKHKNIMPSFKLSYLIYIIKGEFDNENQIVLNDTDWKHDAGY